MEKANVYQGNPPPYNPVPPGPNAYPQPPPPGAVYPPQPGYPSPNQYGQPVTYYPQSSTTIIAGSPAAVAVPVIVGRQMGSEPSSVTCKSCNMNIVTRTETKSTVKTHLFALILCLIGCWPCVCVPYCVDSCNNIDHYCPNCNSYIGTYSN